MTNGEYLRQVFNLENIPEVKIGKIASTAYSGKIYVIFYDSRRPNGPILKRKIQKAPWFFVTVEPFEQRKNLVYLIDIDRWNGLLTPAMFFVYDICGRFTMNDTQDVQTFDEMTLGDFKTKSAASPVTLQFRKERNKLVGTENKLAKLIDVEIDLKKDFVTFSFLTESTSSKSSQIEPFTFSISDNPDNTYVLQVRLLKFFSYLNTKPDSEEITVDDVQDALKVCDVQFWSSSPSFHWQGMNYNLSQVDSAIHPTDIAPKQWDAIHGQTYFLDKHLYGLSMYIDFFLPQMTMKLNSALKKQGLLRSK